MPGYLLRREQLSSLVALGGLEDPGTASPLRGHVRAAEALPEAHPEFAALAEQGLISPRGDGWRVNTIARNELEACLRPDEVISVGIDDVGHPGLGIVRRGTLWSECTVDWRGSAKLYFPLSRSAVLASLVGSIPPGEGDAADAAGGFHFVGSVPDAFVLSSLARELREDPRTPSLAGLSAAVQRAIARPSLSHGFKLLGGPEILEQLTSPDVVSVVVGRLQARNLVTLLRDRVVLEPDVAAALGGFPEATFAINRTVLAGGEALSHWLHVTKTGDRTMLFRPRSPRDGELQLEWREVGNDDLRLLMTGLLLDRTALEASA